MLVFIVMGAGTTIKDDYEITMGVHVKGAFNVVKHSWPHMKNKIWKNFIDVFVFILWW